MLASGFRGTGLIRTLEKHARMSLKNYWSVNGEQSCFHISVYEVETMQNKKVFLYLNILLQ
jgi:hypothetical protein